MPAEATIEAQDLEEGDLCATRHMTAVPYFHGWHALINQRLEWRLRDVVEVEAARIHSPTLLPAIPWLRVQIMPLVGPV